MRIQISLLTLALTSSMLAPLSAHAQTTPSNKAPVANPAPAEIVVTAQRREERLKDVPISVTAVNADELARAGIGDSIGLQFVTPGLSFASQGAYAQPVIRGIGTSVTAAGSDANVSVYIDGVYMPNQNANFFELADVKQVDVLKGPQGTLYGRNATGGAINITTLAPSFSPKGSLSASYGSFNEVAVNAYGAAPLIKDVLAGSLSFFYDDDDGYSKDVLRDKKMSYLNTIGGRAKLLWRPIEKLEITAAADLSHSKDTRGYSLKILNGNTATANAFIPPDPRDVALSFNPNFSTQAGGASVTAKYDAGFATLSDIVAYRQTDVQILTDLDRTAGANSFTSFNIRQDTFTEELNLTSSTPGPLQWVAGVFYYNDTAVSSDLKVNGVQTLNYATVTDESEAIYAQGDYALTKKLTLTAGVRYSNEERSIDAARPTGTPLTIDNSHTWSAFTPRVAARYALDDFSNVYASWSKGFKSGAYNGTAFSAVPVNPESVSAFEVGYKFARGQTTGSVAAFYYDYKNIQVQAVTPATGLTMLTNAAQAEIYGLEADFATRLTDNLRLISGLAYTHSEYTDFTTALITIPKTTAAQCGANPNRPCGNIQQGSNVSGSTMVRTPAVTGNVGLTYDHEALGGDFEASVNEYYNSGFYWTVDNRIKQPAYWMTNAQVSWAPRNSNWRVTLWGKNLADETYEYYVTDTTTGDAVAYAAPRSVGIKVDLKFN